MNDDRSGCRALEGKIVLDGEDIYSSQMDVVQLRGRVGMVFQKPNPFPKSIYDNIAYGPRIHGLTKSKGELDNIVEESLRAAGLWDEVKDRLKESGTALSGGQQQRLCIGRAIAVHPEVVLMDEPCSALDPIATARIEELIHELRGDRLRNRNCHTQHAAGGTRLSADGLFSHGQSDRIWRDQRHLHQSATSNRREDYITGRFG